MRVVVAEDLTLLRDGLSRMLEAYGFEVVAALDDGDGLADRLVELRPDVSIVDVRLPPTFTDEGLRATISARQRIPGLPILILSQDVQRLYASELLSDGAGGVGYLLKSRVADVRDFVDAVQRVAAGSTALDPEVVAQLLGSQSTGSPIDELTPREREVLAVMAEGRSNAAIASQLVIEEKSVSNHINAILSKLGLPPSGDDHRRVLAVLAYLEAAQPS